MKTLLLTLATAATVLATVVPAYAQQHVDCTVVTRANFAACTIQNSTTSSHDG